MALNWSAGLRLSNLAIVGRNGNAIDVRSDNATTERALFFA